MLLLQSSFDYNTVLLLSGGGVTMWCGISFDAAMHRMGKFLKDCSPDRRFTFAQYKSTVAPEDVQPIEQLRKRLRLDSALLEQLDSLTAGEDSGTKFAVALEFLQANRLRSEPPSGMFS